MRGGGRKLRKLVFKHIKIEIPFRHASGELNWKLDIQVFYSDEQAVRTEDRNLGVISMDKTF